MAIPNLQLVYRPLVGGIAIFNPVVGRIGTLGAIAKKADGSCWIISAAHVLFAPNAPGPQSIFQPVSGGTAVAIAQARAVDMDLARDVGFAKISAGVMAILRVTGVGPITGCAAPIVGMNVIKIGAATGVTEGTITLVNGGAVEVKPRADAPAGYDLADPGDSGSAWIDGATGKLVAIHFAGSDTGPEFSKASRVEDLLAPAGLACV